MKIFVHNGRFSALCLLISLILIPTLAIAAQRRATKPAGTAPSQETVEMFSAIEKGDIAVKLIPKDSTQCRIMIENKTQKPLSVKLPETFAAVPVLAQVGGGGVGGGGGGTRAGGTGGGGAQSGGGGMGGMGGGGGMFNVAPEKVGKFDVPTVCLEHGKDEPRPNIPYDIKPLDSVTHKPAVAELCRALGTGQLNQRAAQAAAWFLNNDMSWEQLAAKRIKHANGTSEPYFSQLEIQTGMKVAAMAVKIAEEKQQLKRYSDSGSQSSSGQ
jgi:hypothetical protein